MLNSCSVPSNEPQNIEMTIILFAGQKSLAIPRWLVFVFMHRFRRTCQDNERKGTLASCYSKCGAQSALTASPRCCLQVQKASLTTDLQNLRIAQYMESVTRSLKMLHISLQNVRWILNDQDCFQREKKQITYQWKVPAQRQRNTKKQDVRQGNR